MTQLRTKTTKRKNRCRCYKNPFPSSLMSRPNKLNHLYLKITFQSGLTFAGNTRSLPKKEASERCFNWVGSGLATNSKTRLERVSKDKCFGLLVLIVSNEGTKFSNIDTRSTRRCRYKCRREISTLCRRRFPSRFRRCSAPERDTATPDASNTPLSTFYRVEFVATLSRTAPVTGLATCEPREAPTSCS